MDSSVCFNKTECMYMCNNDDYTIMQKQLEEPMPWIGLYIAAASAACSLAMAADALNGFRAKKLWFPCKYFSLNAFSLTVLAVAMKLPVDLTSLTVGGGDVLARTSSLVLMSTAMGNFMTSLGSMENNEIILNIAALGILVITIVGNVFIHDFQIRDTIDQYTAVFQEYGSTVIMLVMLVNLCSLAIMVPSAKSYIESKYNEMHIRISNKQLESGKVSIDQLRVEVKRYWVMAATGSPQFVTARSAISSTVGLICLSVALTLAEAMIFDYDKEYSTYGWSINVILYIQCIGVALGTIAPLLRWYVAVLFKIPEKSLREELKIEKYWTAKLNEWRDRSLPIQIQHHKCKKLLDDSKRLVLNICIGVQILCFLTSKLLLFISAKFVNAIVFCFHWMKNLRRPDSSAPTNIRGLESRADTEPHLSDYVLLLEGEGDFPKTILKNICHEVDKLIQIGEKKQPKNLIKLLNKSGNFNGVREFDSNELQGLHSPEPPNCWSMPVVTLTSIAIALPNITTDKANQLLRGVSEGLSFVKLIEKTLDRNGELGSIRNAADIAWVGVELHSKWQDKELQSTSIRGKTDEETLQKLSDVAKKIVEDFMAKTKDILMQNPLNWPVKVIAANSMYRVTQTVMRSHRDEELFERLSIMISDILAACLTNLGRAIILKCHRNAIKEREESVRQAAILVGESRDILEILQPRELPSLDLEKAANIDEWRTLQDTEVSQTKEEHVSIGLED